MRRLELVQAQPAVDRADRAGASTSRLTPLRTRTCIRRIRRIQGRPHLVGRPRLDVRAVVAEQDEVDRVARPLLVAQQRLPGALAVDRDRLRVERVDDRRGVAARSGAAPRAGRARPPRRAAGRSRPRPRARGRTCARGSASCRGPRSCGSRRQSAGLVGGRAAHVERPAGEQLGLDAARPRPAGARARAASRAAPRRSRRAPASGTRRRGSCPAGCRSRSCRRSPASTWPTSVVGTATHGTPRR